MNQLTKYILFFLFISISGYSQEVDKRYLTEPNPERFLPELNDIEKVKYVKTLKYYSDSVGNFLEKIEASGYEPEFFVNKYPYRYLYKILPETNDTISKIIYKYNENKNILEYVKEEKKESYTYGGYNQRHWQYNENGEIIKEDVYSENQLSSSEHWIYNSNNQLIRNEKIRYYEEKVNFENIIYYLYNRNNQLVKKIENNNNEIINITTWAYHENNSYHITENSAYKDGMNITIQKDFNSSSDDRYYSGPTLIYTLSDKNNNWIKKTYQNRYSYYTIEREIIYK